MSEAREIFRKQLRLTPGQLRAVAERRYDDAMCLLDSGDNARANGAIYARYSSKHAKREDAREFLNTIAEAKKWLKEP